MKGISGFFYVDTEEAGIITCRAKGIFRKDGVKPLCGDLVRLVITDETDREGNIEEILPRKNTLIRPAVSNIDQAMYVISGTHPKPNLNLLDRFLCMMEYQHIPCVLCVNKTDLTDIGAQAELRQTYEAAGYPVLFLSALYQPKDGREALRAVLDQKMTAIAGPSGVGKSTITNLLLEKDVMETGTLSEKIARGKHTTRHSECHPLWKGTYLFDTPGFGSMFLPELDKEKLQALFPEFSEPSKRCRFRGCVHIGETECGVREAVGTGRIAKSRYENYRLLYEEIKTDRRY